jgi:predicted GTPase
MAAVAAATAASLAASVLAHLWLLRRCFRGEDIVALGRLYASRLTYAGEEQLVAAYLDRNHRYRAKELVDPREYAVRSIIETYKKYPKIGTLLPAMGYDEEQVRDLEETIRRTPCEAVVVATPIDLARIVKIDKPYTRVRYELQEIGRPTLGDALDERARALGLW